MPLQTTVKGKLRKHQRGKTMKSSTTNQSNKSNKSKNTYKEIQHHHFLLRMETMKCPSEQDKDEARIMIENIINDIGMKLLASPHVYYVKYPRYNEGLTAIAPIQTSHIAFHFWARPNPRILSNKKSKCLLQFDIYTCGSLTLKNIQRILHHLTRFEPTHVNATLLNRNWSLTFERHMRWNDADNDGNWQQWLADIEKA
jgi:S-adenosylmethionine/arginine decarboxylase-like enzyme